MSKRKEECPLEIRDEDWLSYLEWQDNELEHYGRLGMKWGQHIFGKEASERRRKRKSERAAKKKQKQRISNLKKARKARAKKKKEQANKAKEELKEQKKRLKTLKNPNTLFKNRNNYTYTEDEINTALRKFDWEQKIDNYSTNRLENTKKRVSSMVGILSSGVGGYNTVASIYNSWFPHDTQLPIIKLNTDGAKSSPGKPQTQQTKPQSQQSNNPTKKSTKKSNNNNINNNRPGIGSTVEDLLDKLEEERRKRNRP